MSELLANIPPPGERFNFARHLLDANRARAHQLIHAVVASIPRCFVVHQHPDLCLACRAFDRLGVFETDGERLFHHHRDVVLRAEFHNLSVIEGAGINKNRLRPGGTQHLLQIRVIQGGIKSELSRVAIKQAAIRIADSNDAYLRPMYGVREKTLYVTVNKSGDGDSKRLCFCRAQQGDGKKRPRQQKRGAAQRKFHKNPPAIRSHDITG